jgi:phosphoglycolate phosphatase-like HAD superfamily hydrolase
VSDVDPASPAGDEERPLAVVDLDGVVADVRHRLRHIRGRRKDWDAFFAAAPDDPPHPEGLAIVRALEQGHEVVFLSGRPERCRRDTEEWLARHGLGGHRVVLRPEGRRQPAAGLKVQLLRRLAAGRRVAVVVDDDEAVLAAVAAAGHPTYHADWERRPERDDAALHEAQETEGRS